MTLKEFEQTYELHDSVLENIEYINGELRIFCCLCDFMQENYTEGKPTNSDIVITFRNACHSVTEGFNVKDAGILKHELNGDTLVFILENGVGTYGELSVQAGSVDVNVIRSYDI